jgi:hypothetical protein
MASELGDLGALAVKLLGASMVVVAIDQAIHCLAEVNREPGGEGPCVFHTTSLLVPSIARGEIEPHTARRGHVLRQKQLILYSADSSLTSRIVGWSLYDGSGEYEFDASDDADAPYPSVLGAMRDGWRVIQLPVLQAVDPGAAQQLAYLRFETVLETLVEV